MADQVTLCNCLALFTLAENWSFLLDEFSCCKDVLLGTFSKNNIIMTKKNVDKKRDYSDGNLLLLIMNTVQACDGIS